MNVVYRWVIQRKPKKLKNKKPKKIKQKRMKLLQFGGLLATTRSKNTAMLGSVFGKCHQLTNHSISFLF